jgi:hypothetical protein
MSKFDRTDLAALHPCDVLAVHKRPGLGRPGDQLACSCGALLEVGPNGRWVREPERNS